MALTLSRVDRTPRTYVLADVMETVPAGVESVQVALLPPRSGPTAATVWTTVTYASGSFDVLWVGPDADASGGLVAPASADAWVKVTDAPLVEAVKLERITVLGGGANLAAPLGVPVVSVNGKQGSAVVLSAADVGAPTTTDLSTGLATKVNSSTYTAGLAGKQDVATLAADAAAHVADGSALDVALRAAFVSSLGRSNGTDDRAAIQAALDAARTAGGGYLRGLPGETYQLRGRLVIGSGTTLDMTGCKIVEPFGVNSRMVVNYAWANPVASGTDGAVAKGANVITTALGAQAVVGQTVRIIGAGGNGSSPLVGNVSARTATTITVTTLDGRPCLATATVSGAAVRLYNRDRRIRIVGGQWDIGDNSMLGPTPDDTTFGGLFFRHVDHLRVDIESWTAFNPGNRGIGLGSVTDFWLAIGRASGGGVAIQLNGPAANGRIDHLAGSMSDDLVAVLGGDYIDQQATAGDVVGLTIGTIEARDTSINILKFSAVQGFMIDGVRIDGMVTGTGAHFGVYIGEENLPNAGGAAGVYGDIDLGVVNVKTTSYPIALFSPHARRVRATVLFAPLAGQAGQMVGVGGPATDAIEVLELDGTIGGLANGTLARNNANYTVKQLVLSDTLRGFRENPDPSHTAILAARIPLPPFKFGDAFMRADSASIGSAESGQAWTVWSGVPGIIGRNAYPTTAANTKFVIASAADGYDELIVNALAGGQAAWLMFRGTDTNNYYRYGYTPGAPPQLALQKVVAGSVSIPSSTALNTVAFRAGVRLGVLRQGSKITLFADGQRMGTADDTFNQTATFVGPQADQIDARFGPIYSRGLINGA